MGASSGSSTSTSTGATPITSASTAAQLEGIQSSINTTGYALWDMVQAGRAKKEATGAAIVGGFVRELYERKSNDPRYENVECEECHGAGSVKYDYPPGSIFYGMSGQCTRCNGLGRVNELLGDHSITRVHSPEFQALMDRLLASMAETPLYTLRPANYRGSVEVVHTARIGGHRDELVLHVRTLFRFLDMKGRPDGNGYSDNLVLEEKSFTMAEIEGFSYSSPRTGRDDGGEFHSNGYVILSGTHGDHFEFTTNSNPTMVVATLNDLVHQARVVQPAGQSVARAGYEQEDTGAEVVAEEEVGYAVALARLEAQGKGFNRKTHPIDFALAQRGAAYLATNGTRPGVLVMPSGLQCEVISKGTLELPRASDIVTVRIDIRHIDGTALSFPGIVPPRFSVDTAIPGLQEALQQMPARSTWKLYMPPELAYGAGGVDGVVGPGEVLVMEVELLAVER